MADAKEAKGEDGAKAGDGDGTAKAEGKIDEELLPRRIRSIKSPFIKRVAIFCDSETLLEDLEQFCVANCQGFARRGEGGEYPLEATEVHAGYNQLIENKLQRFMDREGVTEEAFMEACQQAQGREDDPSANRFVQMLMGALEFEHFAVLMEQLQLHLEAAAEHK